MKLLLVEDDMEISQMLKDYLRAENYEVVCAADGKEACEKFDSDSYALVLLDLMIPKISGMEVMQHIRQSSTVPIIIVSAKDTDADKTLGLGLGADDYITKPFSVTEVLARIKANIRRSTQYSKPAEPENETLVIGDLVMNLTDYTVTKKNVRVDLTAKEYEILKLLLQNPKKVYTKPVILCAAYFEVSGDRKHEFYRVIHRPCHEIIKSNHYFVFPADFSDTGQYR